MPGVDALYDAAAEDFVAARDALAKVLRSSGERDAAGLVKQLRRPTRAAWALNQLARRHPDDVRALVDLGHALADAQERALAGHEVDLRQAGRARMDVLRQLTRLAEGILGPGAAAQRDEVVATLTAASADPAAGTELLAGRLAEPLGAPAGFGDPLAGWGLAGSTTTPGRDERAPATAGGTAERRSGGSRPASPAPPPADLATARAAVQGRKGLRRPASTEPARPPADAARAAARAHEERERADAARAAAEARAHEAGERADAARAAVASAEAALAASRASADDAADRVRALEAELDAAREGSAAARAAVATDTSALEAARRDAAEADRVAREAADALASRTGHEPG